MTGVGDTAPSGSARPKGPGAEFEMLLRPVLPRAYRAAFHMARDAADAEDLVHEAVLMALRGFDGFEPGTNFRAWFLRILTNAFRMRWRKQKRRGETVPIDETPPLYLAARLHEGGLAAEGADPAADFFSRLGTEQVTEAIRGLPRPYREVASLYFVEDLPYEEIAGILGCPIGTVRSRLHRARALLQRRLWQAAVECGVVASAG